MKRSLITVAFAVVVILAGVALGQEKSKDTVQVLAGYVNSEIKNPVEAIQNARTLSVDGKVNVVNRSGWTFGPAFNYQRAYDVEVVMDSEVYPNGIYRDVSTYFGGVELAKKAGPFRFGGGFFLGTRRIHEDAPRELVRKYRGFFEIVSGHFVLRPFFAEIEATGGFNANRSHKYGAGTGVRF